MPEVSLVARTMVHLADSLVGDFDLVELLTSLADSCVEVLGVSAAGVMLVGPAGELRAVASSSEAMRTLELFEIQSHQGPCLDSFSTGVAIAHEDLHAAVGRWPLFAPEAINAGFSAVQALPMRLRDTVVGALNLFHVDGGTLRAVDIATAQAFADVATIAILQHRIATDAVILNSQLNNALTSRIVIEQAKGIVAERRGVAMEQAFSAIRRYARTNNLRLVEVAADVVSGALSASKFDQGR